ncbi:hypothetical protein I3843_16G045000 [Carya illinoinensis]|nr:cold-regulated protein 27-like isoform X1 [Carya illinoinensis]KAG2663668.1 hypothetical protein I3760_16G043900 [Carya illinoinensis]KAG7941469.1 hypothetical protein I3843_16G045000 [Carya illinoinensis]KAG7941470.1 hypothetical protein I3843_16G045000 [Carya illinoinensis]
MDFGARAGPTSSTVSNDGSFETKEPSSLCTEWTDEKHSLYLKSMEASFVNQLYDSTDLLGFCRFSDPAYSRKKHLNTRITSGQFKVLRGGCWQKINFARAYDLQLKKAKGSRVLLTNPWIRHFRTGCTPQVVAPADVQNNTASTSEALGLVGNHAMFCGSATCNSEHIHGCQFHLCHRDLVGSGTEVSDQNFVDEEVEGEKENGICNGKRMKSCSTDAPGNDQVVPHNNSSTTEDVTTNCISAARCNS